MPEDLYGGFDLRRGDRDRRPTGEPAIRGGTERPDEDAEHVLRLQRDLQELGFMVVGGADGDFLRRTQWAVREFQIYARMERAAREDAASAAARYSDRLSPVATGGDRYAGPVSGVVNAATRAAIRHWLAERWRCPVVVEAWNMAGGAPHTLRASNLWLHDEVSSTVPRMFVRDCSGYYGLPPSHAQGAMVVVGDFVTYLRWSGPRSVPPRHVAAQGELVPEGLVGKPLGELTAAERSTFKVVRAVSEVECLGFFDSVNAYDNAFVSVGPCHWTLGIVNSNGSVSDGELCGYLSYLAHADPGAFERALGFFGVRVDVGWTTGAGEPTGKRLFNAGQRKYAAWLALERDDGSFERLAKSEQEADYFKTWHWFYRFVMAGRTIDGYRRRMWDMARVRLRDLRAAPWSGTRTLGDVFTSERASAILLRWHVRFPGDVIDGGKAGPRLHDALARARQASPALDWNGDPEGWTDGHEAALLRGLRAEVEKRGNKAFSDTIREVDAWPSWAAGVNPRGYALSPQVGRLSERRASLVFDGAGLPPAPNASP